MSQRRQKKQLSALENASSLTDHELREALKSYNQNPGPITDSTRNLYRKKLASLLEDKSTEALSTSSRQLLKVRPDSDLLGDDDDSTDEDYNAQDEETEDDEFDDEETDESSDMDEEISDDELNEDIKLSSTTTDTMNSSAIIGGGDAAPNRISRGIFIMLLSFFVAIFSFYLFSSGNIKSLVNFQKYKNVTKQMLIILAMSPIAYVIYRIMRYYKLRRHQEMQRVCDLVNEALELLQSPDNPKSSLPILHIRDTLLTPAERKTKHMTNLWTKAVKFIEEHESRVKVELVNIDGEDFRAWKWIGSRKL